jgi:large subunit ribosomal protein L38
MKGSGWHRCVYVLFEHSQPVGQRFNQDTKFQKRSFKTSEFYLQNQDNLTPVGLSFFQTEWDLSVKNVFHNYFGKPKV